MNWLFDSPFTILLASIAVGFFLGVAWVQTGRNAFLYAIGGLVVVAILLLIVERYVETDGEKVRKLIYVIAADVESNDPQRVVKHIVSTQPELRDKAASEMKNYHFDHVTIGTIHRLEELPEKQPPQVVIEFNVTVGGSFGGLSDDNFPRWVQLTFWKDTDGQWRIADYDHREPTAFMKKRE